MTVKSRIFSTGGYIYLDNELVKGWHKCSHGEFFAYQSDNEDQLKDKLAKWVGPKIPADIMGLALAAIAYKPDTEVELCLYFSKRDGKWMINLPKQRATGASVHYDDTEFKQPQGYAFQGTIHSHPNMNAFWSGTDTADQTGKSGVHIVVGTDHGKMRQMLCSLWINGQIYDASNAVELPEGDLPEISKEWKDILDTPMPEPKVEPACTPYKFVDWRERAFDEWCERQPYSDAFETCPQDYKGPNTNEPEWQTERNIDMSMLYEGATAKEKLYDLCWLLRDLGYEDMADEVESSITADIEGFEGYESSDSYECLEDFDLNEFMPVEAGK